MPLKARYVARELCEHLPLPYRGTSSFPCQLLVQYPSPHRNNFPIVAVRKPCSPFWIQQCGFSSSSIPKVSLLQGNAYLYFARHILREKKQKASSGHFTLNSIIPSVGWVRKAWMHSEEEILESSGLDAVVYLRVFLFCIRFFGICTIAGIGVLLPVNYFQGAVDITTIGSDALDKFSISNVSDGSNRLWVHFSILYCISFLAYGLLYMEYVYITRKRIAFLKTRRPQLDQFTVLVRAIPKAKEKSFSEQVEEFFSSYHPYTYLLHQIVLNDKKVQKMLSKVQVLAREIESLKSLPLEQRRPQRTGFLGLIGSKQDPLELYTKQVEELRKKIKESQTQSVQAAKDLPVAFVSFKTRWGAAVAAQTQQSSNPLQWVTEWAPEPRDVNWSNLLIPYTQLWMRRLLIGVVLGCIILLFFIPAALVYTLARLDNLMTWFPFIQTVLSIPVISSFLSGYLPSLLLTVLYYFIPFLMMALTKVEGYPSYSSQERTTAGKVFLFLVGNSFFLVTYGSLLSLISQAIDSPRQIPNLLASSLPGQANFFMNFIMTKGWTGLATETLQPYPIISGFLLKYLLGKQHYGPRIEPLKYFRALPNVLLFVFIGFMYTLLAPLLLPFLMVYLIMGYIVFRNQIMNMYEPAYETGGQYWPHVHNRVIASLFLMQLIGVGIFGVKEKTSASTATIPLLLITLIFNHYCNMRFLPAYRDLPVEITMPKDQEDEKTGYKDQVFDLLQTAYYCPSLQPMNMILPSDDNYEPLLSHAYFHSETV
ncbi:hypothetical protein GOP47_0015286 [Adiantum capillus-veneris]|uniref:Uncharacterized protein n=1 Tax=Adiantum capillus-veneris TaxID=13818 RepID=A0A9D4UJH6_ADICA|nr:hypothetical protein GOP47_0015286 [Adiantum capillus-veneris]